MTYLGGSVVSLATDRNTWHGRADQAWGASRVWNSGSSFETDSATWHARADQAWGDSQVWNSGTSYKAQRDALQAQYNALLAGLNNPEGLQSQSFSISHSGGGSEVQIGTFTFGRTGHFLVAVVCPISAPNVSQNNSSSVLRLAGVATATLTAAIGATGGVRNWWHSWAGDVDVSSGQTISLFYNAFTTGNPTTGTATVYAHFVPTSTNHN